MLVVNQDSDNKILFGCLRDTSQSALAKRPKFQQISYYIYYFFINKEWKNLIHKYEFDLSLSSREYQYYLQYARLNNYR